MHRPTSRSCWVFGIRYDGVGCGIVCVGRAVCTVGANTLASLVKTILMSIVSIIKSLSLIKSLFSFLHTILCKALRVVRMLSVVLILAGMLCGVIRVRI